MGMMKGCDLQLVDLINFRNGRGEGLLTCRGIEAFFCRQIFASIHGGPQYRAMMAEPIHQAD